MTTTTKRADELKVGDKLPGRSHEGTCVITETDTTNDGRIMICWQPTTAKLHSKNEATVYRSAYMYFFSPETPFEVLTP